MMSDVVNDQRYFATSAIWSTSEAAWRSLHLRQYRHEREVEELETPPALDQVVVLVTRGSTLIESFRASRWRSAAHLPGNVGMTSPGERARLRWRGKNCHETLHLHLPPAIIEAALDDARESGLSSIGYPAALSSKDEVVAAVFRSLARAADEGMPDLYAASAGHFLARHLIAYHSHLDERVPTTGEAGRLRRIEDYINAHLAYDITLQDLASVAGCSAFQLIRLFKTNLGRTPFQHIFERRMDLARRLLRAGEASIVSVAMDCGYANPSHFATAFRRATGMSPSDYRNI